MRKHLLAIVFIAICSATSAQQVATYAQYMFNGLAINPAYAGSHEALSATALVRFQNVGLDGAPKTQTFSLHSPLLNKRVGLGMLAIRDEIGVITQTGLNFSYAYRIPVSEKLTLSMGLQGGFGVYDANYTELEVPPTNDPAFQQNVHEIRPNIGAGLYLYSRDYYIGLSAPHLVNNAFDRGENFETIYQNKPILLTAGYVFPIHRLLKLKPSFLLKVVDDRPVEFDLNANLLFDEVLWAGISYKSTKTISVILQAQVTDQIQFGYSYQITAGPIRVVELGSHEVMLNYRFKYNKKNVVSPRYF
ncbi:MAG TPA: type IX secretion system membrane protein PorP/SprF [Cyclobacteriaceae bacterium]|nr:type IX secretion system membrane protein PorP/SprF [Cyclobacteriaceae bacterium]